MRRPRTQTDIADLLDVNSTAGSDTRIRKREAEDGDVGSCAEICDMFHRLDHVQLAIPADSETIARTFYIDVLGFEEVPKPEELVQRGGAWFRSGDVALHVGVDASFIPAKKAHPALRCADYPSLLARLERHGVVVTPDPLPFDGRPHCYIADPFGNRLELIG